MKPPSKLILAGLATGLVMLGVGFGIAYAANLNSSLSDDVRILDSVSATVIPSSTVGGRVILTNILGQLAPYITLGVLILGLALAFSLYKRSVERGTQS